jgi:ABC-2 type transport system ATP-binding protein
MPAIVADNLTRRFDSLIAADALTFHVDAGEVFGYVGPDGAGKTTTMRMLASILTPTSGTATVAGFDVATHAEQVKESIGVMSQRFGLYSDLTVLENIDFYADVYGMSRRGRRDEIDRLLTFSGLLPFVKRRAGRLSGGMKQKLGLACALIHQPKILLLDEPTNGVDPVSRREFWRLLYQLVRQGVTMFVSTSYLDEAERCHRLAMIDRGRIVTMGTIDAIKSAMPGCIVEVRCNDPRSAMQTLRESHPAWPVGLFGDTVHVHTEHRDAQHDIHRTLSKRPQSFESVRAIEPTLEDVFIAVTASRNPSEVPS